MDLVIDVVTYFVEKFVLVLGPVLICFASTIIYGLSWTFFTILLPMIQRKHDNNPWVIAGHVSMVIFLLVEICFNYFMCVRTPNKGKNFDRVVRELAVATNFEYPETPMEVESFRRDYEARMNIRMQRRQQKAAAIAEEEAVPLVQTTNSPEASIDGDIKNRKTASNSNKTPRITTKKQPSPKQIRNWMLMAPDEWGYCQRSNQPKPPRSHYDHVTRTLVLCLDHYCPWMFNAIGYFNYRYFCNFLWFVQIAMIYGATISFQPFKNTSGPLYREQAQEFRRTGERLHANLMVPINSERMAISLSFMLCLAVGLAVACLGGFHFYLCLTAQTTIEFHGNFMNRRKAKRLNKKWTNPYSLGWRRNFQQVFGTQPAWKAFLIPSTREPEFLPLPMPDGLRSNYSAKATEVTRAAKGADIV